MIHYHGTPIGGPHDRAAESLNGRHAFVSFAAPSQLDIVLDACQSFACDNGAFSAWRGGKQVTDWGPYYSWVAEVMREPGFDWAVIPDVIDGSEDEQDNLLDEWPHGFSGVPVWHMNESMERLNRLVSYWPRVAIGSTGDYKAVGTRQWWLRMGDAMHAICENGYPRTKLHGLRMLDMEVFQHLPFASADSTSAAFNSHVDSAWKGTYEPPKPWRTRLLMARIEAVNGARRWAGKKQDELFPLVATFQRVHPSECPEVPL